MTQTYPKKRLSIIIEAPFLNRLLDLLDGLDVPGYTALPALG
ncbi:MAG TPA: transcriptional regulator, partial [Rhodospirillaceae bacterium]|nr:transcriptional regulator [Rhodospirillaceae bacterium]